MIYVGEWYNNKKNGLGILYNNNNIIYKGEWNDDKKHGYGIHYDNFGNIKYNGEWIDDDYRTCMLPSLLCNLVN